METVNLVCVELAAQRFYVDLVAEDLTPLDCTEYDVYGGAQAAGREPVAMELISQDRDAAVLELPGLPLTSQGTISLVRQSWRYQLFAKERSSGREFLLVGGSVELIDRYDESVVGLSPEELVVQGVISGDSIVVTVAVSGGLSSEQAVELETAFEHVSDEVAHLTADEHAGLTELLDAPGGLIECPPDDDGLVYFKGSLFLNLKRNYHYDINALAATHGWNIESVCIDSVFNTALGAESRIVFVPQNEGIEFTIGALADNLARMTELPTFTLGKKTLMLITEGSFWANTEV